MPISVDHVNPYDMLAMNGASAALMISHIPFPTPVGAVRIGKVDGNFVVNPNEEDLLDNTDLDLVVAGRSEERRVGKSVDLCGRRIMKKKKRKRESMTDTS